MLFSAHSGVRYLVLLAGLLAAAGIWTFLFVADEVVEGETQRFDERVLLALREPGDPADPVGPVWVEEAARDITALGSVTVLFLVVTSVVVAPGDACTTVGATGRDGPPECDGLGTMLRLTASSGGGLLPGSRAFGCRTALPRLTNASRWLSGRAW